MSTLKGVILKTNDLNNFYSNIKSGKTEEDIKHAYAKYFDLKYDTSDYIDLYTPRVLFEFKYDKNLKNLHIRSQTLAQTMYYVRRLKYGQHIDKPISPIICLADHNEAILTETSIWKEFYDNGKYDWDLAPSFPDQQLVRDIEQNQNMRDLHVYDIIDPVEFYSFADLLKKHLNNELDLKFEDKKIISEDNFEGVFEYWNKIFGDSVRNGFKTSRYFVSDIQKDNTVFIKNQSKAFFRIGQTGDVKEKKILAKDYEYFWSLYEKVSDVDVLRAILSKIDRLTDETMRRFYGEFFTPLKFAKKALDYIEKAVGNDWWKSGEFRLWDMAAGTGNLEYYLPQDALKYCYLSTLYKEDVEHLEKLFPDALNFQYDYLNDDIENLFADKAGFNFDFNWKLPEKLRNDLNNSKIKWIILINPPFATAQKAGTSGGSKKGVSETKLRDLMHTEDLGETSRELFVQFLYRIKYEFANKISILGLFSTMKYLNANNDQKFRDRIFDFAFRKGFVFSSANFDGTKKNNAFPVSFIIWDLLGKNEIKNQDVNLDVFNDNVEKIDSKNIISENRENFLNKWIKRSVANIKYPPFGSAVEIKSDNIDKRDRVSRNFLASLMCNGNDFQHSNNTALLSGPYVSAGALSVTPENFTQAMVVHAARRVPKATWLNDRDQFKKPEGDLTDEFILDCTVWNLFSNSNNTVAMKDVEYEGEIYQIHNHFFPFPVNEVKKWNITDSDIAFTLATAQDTFVASWLTSKSLSPEANALLEKGREIYQYYFSNLNQIRTSKYKIHTWDAGWWQIRQSLADVDLGASLMKEIKVLHDGLKNKILPKLKEYRIIE